MLKSQTVIRCLGADSGCQRMKWVIFVDNAARFSSGCSAYKELELEASHDDMVHASGADVGKASAPDSIEATEGTDALQVVAGAGVGELGLLGWIVGIPADREAHALADREGLRD